MRSTSQERASHLARAIFCWLPPLRPAVMVSSDGAFTRRRRVWRSARSRSVARFTQPSVVREGRAAREVFSRLLRPSTRPWRFRSSGTRPRPAARAASREPRARAEPLTVTRPVAAGSRPKMASTTSLRPAPTMPAMPAISPARTDRSMPENLRGDERPSVRRRSSPSGLAIWLGVAISSSRPIIWVTTRCGVVSGMRSVATCLPSRRTVMLSQSANSSSMRCET